MNRPCLKFSDTIFDLQQNRLSAQEQADWQAHLERCPDCREQLAMHEALIHTYMEAPVPQLSDNLCGFVFAEIAKESTVQPAKNSARIWMPIYWIAAGLMSLFILWKMEWSAYTIQHTLLSPAVLILVPLSFIVILFPDKVLPRFFRLAAPLFR
jgi:hypothetical protein